MAIAQPVGGPPMAVAQPVYGGPPVAQAYPPVAQPQYPPAAPAPVAQWNTGWGAPPQQQYIIQAPPPPQNQIIVHNDNVVIQTSAAEQKQRLNPDSIDESKLMLVHGCCCCNTSLALQDSCLGVAVKEAICCIELECCLKVDADPLDCGCCALRCVDATSCIKAQSQVFCLVTSAAFPPDEEVPCTLALFGIACAPSCGCCATLGELTGETFVGTQQTVVVAR